jgi:hypothetical protein
MEDKFEPTQENQEKLNFQQRLNGLLNDWSEEIPDEIIHSTSEKKNYKVRGGWFTAIIHSIELGIHKGYIPESFTTEVHSFLKDFKERHGLVSNDETVRTTPEEIEKGNQLLRKAREYTERS